MPMQPLSRVNPKASLSMMQDDTMRRQPEIAAVVAECIGVWAEIDTLLGHTLAMVLGSDHQAGLAMYLSLSGSAAQRAALDAASKVKLTDPQKETFDAVLQVVTKVGRQRNKLAHWCWGWSPHIKDALILIDPTYKTQHLAGMDDPRSWAFDKRHAYVVRKQDVEEILRDLIEARNLTGRISGFLWNRNTPEQREKFRLQLDSEPPIQTALRQMRKKSEKLPKGAS